MKNNYSFFCHSRLSAFFMAEMILAGILLVLMTSVLIAQTTSIKLPASDSSANYQVLNSSDAKLLRLNGDAGFYFGGAYGTGVIPATGAGTRLMWYPAKAAFRAGLDESTYWNDVNIGNYSTAMGFDTKASGHYSIAVGYYSRATGNYSTATGGSQADGEYSTALGGAAATGIGSTAMGFSTGASGNYSTAMGYNAGASGTSSTAFGEFVTASGNNSTATGYRTTASGGNSTAMGFWAKATGIKSKAMGDSTIASGYASTAMGFRDTASAPFSTAMGYDATASGYASTAMGMATTASGGGSTAMGQNTSASGEWSTAMNYYTTASGSKSTAMGGFTTASGGASTAMGQNTSASGYNSTATGYQTTANSDYTTAMGTYVSTNSKSGAFIIGDNSSGGTTTNSSANNEMMMRFAGGYKFYTNSTATLGCSLAVGGTSWATISDSTKKENYEKANGEYFLSSLSKIRLGSWNYKGQEPAQFRHYGPMAQEIFHYFGKDNYGTIGNSITLASADMDGIMMICLQALEKRTVELQKATAKIAEMEGNISMLTAKLEKLSQIVSTSKMYTTNRQ